MPAADPTALRSLCTAACTGDLERADALLAEHAGLTRASPLAAALVGDEEALAALLAEDPEHARRGLGRWRPLGLAALSAYARPGHPRALGVLACVRLLLEAGADPADSMEDDDAPAGRRTALGSAAGETANVELVQMLLDAGAPPDDGCALTLAAARGSWTCAARILEAGGDWDATDPEQRSAPLHWMLDVSYTRAHVLRVLELGADPNRRVGERRESALHVAALRRRAEVIAPLVEAGAELEARTVGGMTARRHARRRLFEDVVAALDAAGAVEETSNGDELAVALQEERLDDARALLDGDADLRVGLPNWNPEEARLLPDLAAWGKLAGVELLLDAGLPIDARGLDGGTALHQSAWFGQPQVARRLVERGAPLDLRGDQHDSTPLGWVAHGSRYSGGAAEREAFYAEVARVLLEAGAPLPTPDQRHDHPQLREASAGVARVLRDFGWSP